MQHIRHLPHIKSKPPAWRRKRRRRLRDFALGLLIIGLTFGFMFYASGFRPWGAS